WRGRSSFLRQLILYGFEKASADPEAFLREVRDVHDPLFGRRGRSEAGADRRETMVSQWEQFFPKPTPPLRGRTRSVKRDG
ncbi:MAG TPA: hypothetical protein VEG42_01975, partial [Thermoplasmata archaeon]|nr:hypothetical protein [Thermoplasmata archaeon]